MFRHSLIAVPLALLFAAPVSADTLYNAADYSLTDTALLDADATLLGHPTNYPHRHVRRRRVVRRRVVRRPPQQRRRRAGDDKSSIYFGVGGIGNYFFNGASDASRVYNGGGGIDLMFGARFNRLFALELNYFAAFQSTERSGATQQVINDAQLHGITLDGKIFVAPGLSRIEPYVQVGVGAYILSELFREELSGFGFQAGAGVDIRLTDNLALGVRGLYRGFYVDNSSNNYYAIATESAFLNTISGEAYVQFHF